MFWRLCVCVFTVKLPTATSTCWWSVETSIWTLGCETARLWIPWTGSSTGETCWRLCIPSTNTVFYFILPCAVQSGQIRQLFFFHFGVISFGLVWHSNHTWVQTKTIMTRPLTGDRGLVLKELWSGSFVGGMWSSLGPTHDSCGWMFVSVWDTINCRIS